MARNFQSTGRYCASIVLPASFGGLMQSHSNSMRGELMIKSTLISPKHNKVFAGRQAKQSYGPVKK